MRLRRYAALVRSREIKSSLSAESSRSVVTKVRILDFVICENKSEHFRITEKCADPMISAVVLSPKPVETNTQLITREVEVHRNHRTQQVVGWFKLLAK